MHGSAAFRTGAALVAYIALPLRVAALDLFGKEQPFFIWGKSSHEYLPFGSGAPNCVGSSRRAEEAACEN